MKKLSGEAALGKADGQMDLGQGQAPGFCFRRGNTIVLDRNGFQRLRFLSEKDVVAGDEVVTIHAIYPLYTFLNEFNPAELDPMFDFEICTITLLETMTSRKRTPEDGSGVCFADFFRGVVDNQPAQEDSDIFSNLENILFELCASNPGCKDPEQFFQALCKRTEHDNWKYLCGDGQAEELLRYYFDRRYEKVKALLE